MGSKFSTVGYIRYNYMTTLFSMFNSFHFGNVLFDLFDENEQNLALQKS